MSARRYDLVLFGLGFTGSLMADYLVRRGGDLKWAVAGRYKHKLEATLERIEAKGVDILLADTGDRRAVEEVVKNTKVVLSAAGPFARHGEQLVAACVEYGTHWVDITGESPWVRSMIDKYGEVAKRSGSVIVSMCGFDSVPSDIGTLYTVERIKQEFKEGTRSVKGYYEVKASFSGGTFESVMNLVTNYDKQALMEAGNPFYLNPGRQRVPPASGQELPSQEAEAAAGPKKLQSVGKEHRDVVFPGYDRAARAWTWPFIMAGVNTRVVRRSAALAEAAGRPYGKDFAYNEVAKSSNLFMAAIQFLVLAVSLVVMAVPPLRWFAHKFVMPKPGQGPSKQTREKSWFRASFIGTSESGRVMRTSVSGRDPGYDETAKFAVEAALLLAKEKDSLPCAKQGGFMTPAFALGHRYIRALEDADIKFAWATQ